MEKGNIEPERKIYIYLDESGDLGFSGGGSKYFTIAFLVTERPVEVKRVIKRIKQKYKIPRNVELKANTTKRNIRKDLLNKFSRLEIEIQSITVKKKNVDLKLQGDTNILYNYMVGLSLGERIVRSELQNAKVNIIVDKRTISVTSGFKFDEYLKYKVWYEKGRKDIDFQIQHLESHRVYGLEAIDNIVNAIFRKYNSSDFELFNIIQGEITYDKTLFFNK
jgi:hypothetical protein